ncbi:unnamed protein product [Closterium sp. Naga37s-1]|nr:unnamed protein product [Closterium sp. Naga37s-1]
MAAASRVAISGCSRLSTTTSKFKEGSYELQQFNTFDNQLLPTSARCKARRDDFGKPIRGRSPRVLTVISASSDRSRDLGEPAVWQGARERRGGKNGRAPRRSVAAAAAPRDGREGPALGDVDGKAWFEDDVEFVLHLASDEELRELWDILYGRSLFSPVFKSITAGDGSASAAQLFSAAFGESSEGLEREDLIQRLEARFFFLSADARDTVTGNRPSYRDVLLTVRQRLGVRCSVSLSTPDLESEIFLHLLNNYADTMEEDIGSSSSTSSSSGSPWAVAGEWAMGQEGKAAEENRRSTRDSNWDLGFGNEEEEERGKGGGLGSWAVGTLRSGVRAAMRMGRDEILATFLKGGSALTLTTVKKLLLSRITGRVLYERAKYEVTQMALKRGGQLVLSTIESRLAFYSAKQGLAAATARYVSLRSAMALLGPLLWGAFIADVVVQSLGTDYARVVRAIFSFAQTHSNARTAGLWHPCPERQAQRAAAAAAVIHPDARTVPGLPGNPAGRLPSPCRHLCSQVNSFSFSFSSFSFFSFSFFSFSFFSFSFFSFSFFSFFSFSFFSFSFFSFSFFSFFFFSFSFFSFFFFSFSFFSFYFFSFSFFFSTSPSPPSRFPSHKRIPHPPFSPFPPPCLPPTHPRLSPLLAPLPTPLCFRVSLSPLLPLPSPLSSLTPPVVHPGRTSPAYPSTPRPSPPLASLLLPPRACSQSTPPLHSTSHPCMTSLQCKSAAWEGTGWREWHGG